MFKLFSNTTAEVNLESVEAFASNVPVIRREMEVGKEEEEQFREMVAGIICSVSSIQQEAAAYTSKYANSRKRIINVDVSGTVLSIHKSYPLKKTTKKASANVKGSKLRNRRKRSNK